MKCLFLIALACLSPGCATTMQVSETLPDYASVRAIPEAQRGAYFDKMKVAEVKTDYARIGDNWYSRSQLKHIYKANGATEARRQANSSFAKYLGLKIAPPLTFGLATFLGFYVGLVEYTFSGTSSYDACGCHHEASGSANGNTMIIGTAIGAALGATAALIEYRILRKSATEALDKSGKLFNKHLLQELNFDLLPENGGAKAGVNLPF